VGSEPRHSRGLKLAAHLFVAGLQFSCAATQVATDSASPDMPEVVVSVYSNWESPPNNTVFVLYSSGRILSSLTAPSTGVAFVESKLGKGERAKFVDGLGVADLAGLKARYNELLADTMVWVVETWKEGQPVRVQANVSMGCSLGKLREGTGYEELPNAFAKVLAQVCAFKDDGRPWEPSQFQLRWVSVGRSDGSATESRACPWPRDWEALAPPADLNLSDEVTTKAPGGRLGEVETFIRDCAKSGRVVTYKGLGFSVSARVKLPEEHKWWHWPDG
jgi:hypothetical protein